MPNGVMLLICGSPASAVIDRNALANRNKQLRFISGSQAPAWEPLNPRVLPRRLTSEARPRLLCFNWRPDTGHWLLSAALRQQPLNHLPTIANLDRAVAGGHQLFVGD